MNIDLINTPEELSDCPLTRYFLETKKNTALEWVSFLDDDTLLMAKTMIEQMEGESFKTEAELEALDDKYDDIVYLTIYMVAHETNTPVTEVSDNPSINLTEAVQTLNVYLNCDSLRRKGMVEIENGNGALLNPTSKFQLSAKGKKFAKNLAKHNEKE